MPESPDRESLECAILKTVLYSDLFDYALTPAEVAHYLVETACSDDEILKILSADQELAGRISLMEGFVVMRGRENLVHRRYERARYSRRLWRLARFYVGLLSRLPFIRMAAVTGALAMDNSDKNDDVDLLIVAAPGRVWLARAFAVLVVFISKLTRATLCPNYVISEEVRVIEPQTVYVAHEFLQMVPLYGTDVYGRLKAMNPWALRFLPNANHPLRTEAECRPGWFARKLKSAAEWLLSGHLGDGLESWEMQRKVHKFTMLRTAGPNVIFDRHQVKGHFDDHGERISAQYQARLEEYRLAAHKPA